MKTLGYIFFIFVLSWFAQDFYLTKYGHGNGIFSDGFPGTLSIEKDRYRGIIIREEGFMTVIGKKSVIKSDTIAEILCYNILENSISVICAITSKDTIEALIDYKYPEDDNRFSHSLDSKKYKEGHLPGDYINVSESNKTLNTILIIQTLIFLIGSIVLLIIIIWLSIKVIRKAIAKAR